MRGSAAPLPLHRRRRPSSVEVSRTAQTSHRVMESSDSSPMASHSPAPSLKTRPAGVRPEGVARTRSVLPRRRSSTPQSPSSMGSTFSVMIPSAQFSAVTAGSLSSMDSAFRRAPRRTSWTTHRSSPTRPRCASRRRRRRLKSERAHSPRQCGHGAGSSDPGSLRSTMRWAGQGSGVADDLPPPPRSRG